MVHGSNADPRQAPYDISIRSGRDQRGHVSSTVSGFDAGSIGARAYLYHGGRAHSDFSGHRSYAMFT